MNVSANINHAQRSISPPRRTVLRRARELQSVSAVLCEAEGSAPLHRKAIQDSLDESTSRNRNTGKVSPRCLKECEWKVNL